MHYAELSTPALTIDLDALERNLDRMAKLCRDQGVALRPHIKTHKTPEVARMQLARGAVGVSVAKVGEAEVMAEAGLDNMLVAYPIWGEEKLLRLATLGRTCTILVSLDHEATAAELSRAAVAQSATMGVLVEFEAGSHRCGVQTGESAVALAKKVASLPNLQFRGLMTYFGSIWGFRQERVREVHNAAVAVAKALAAFEDARLLVDIVSGGSTPAAEFAGDIRGLTEVRPGTYVYNDLNTFYQGACRLDDCAARVVTTVVSTAVPGKVILDAGSKTLSSDALRAGSNVGYGMIVEAPDAPILKLNEEHGHVDVTRSSHEFHVGEMVTVIPNHVCTCVNMHDEAFLVRRDEVVGSWRVAARGKIR